MSKRTRYGFEEALKLPKYTPYGRADSFYTNFLENLRLKDSPELDEDAKALLERYVANVHVNCSWYNNQVRSEKFLQTVYFVMSVALLILVPLIIYFSPDLFAEIGKQFLPVDDHLASEAPAELTARLTTLLAGFFAAHKTISAWLNQRKLIGPFWKARSDLLNEIYTLETEWGPKKQLKKVNTNGVLAEDFRQAIEASLKTARAAVQTERTQFYKSYTFPDVNLSGSLSQEGTVAGKLVSMFESASVKKQRELAMEREAHVTRHDNLKADVAGLTAILAELEVELDVKRTEQDHSTDPGTIQKLKDEVSAMVAEMAKLTTQRKIKIQQQAQERVRAGLG